MANRSELQKRRKMQRRFRFAKFSGATTKYAVRIDRGRYQEVTKTGHGAEEDLVPSGKHVVIPVGPISLSKAVMNTGRGPDKERMQQYYDRLNSFDEALPKTLGLSEPLREMKKFELTKRYQEFIKGVPREMHINFQNDELGRLDLFFKGNQFFFVEVNYQKKYWRRSTIYSSRRHARVVMDNDAITWVETIP